MQTAGTFQRHNIGGEREVVVTIKRGVARCDNPCPFNATQVRVGVNGDITICSRLLPSSMLNFEAGDFATDIFFRYTKLRQKPGNDT